MEKTEMIGSLGLIVVLITTAKVIVVKTLIQINLSLLILTIKIPEIPQETLKTTRKASIVSQEMAPLFKSPTSQSD